jgi:hypothetical protein
MITNEGTYKHNATPSRILSQQYKKDQVISLIVTVRDEEKVSALESRCVVIVTVRLGVSNWLS